MGRGIDHIVVAAGDLDALQAFWRSLGFRVGARNRHPWGTLNHIIQFPGHFLELIATEPGFVRPKPDEPVAQFAGFLADYLERREGPAMLVLESGDAAGDQAQFADAGMAGPSLFRFERQGKRPDGSPVHVAFTLAFARRDELNDAGFFVCQQHYPENFWNPAFQVHDNGIRGLDAIVLAAPEPQAVASFFSTYTGVAHAEPMSGGLRIVTPRGTIEVATPAAFASATGFASPVLDHGPRFVALKFRVPDLAAFRDRLSAEGITADRRGPSLFIPPERAFGTSLVFSPE